MIISVYYSSSSVSSPPLLMLDLGQITNESPLNMFCHLLADDRSCLRFAQCLSVGLMVATNLALQLSAAVQQFSNLLAHLRSSHLRTTLLPLDYPTQDHLAPQ